MRSELVKQSRRLSKILRHDPQSAGITLDENGWADVPSVLRALSVSAEDLALIVSENDKQRFELDAERGRIRARQGHSVKVDLQLEEKNPPAELYHGTSSSAWSSIQATGLVRMKRHHVHLSADVDTARRVGDRRRDDTIILKVNAAAMRAAGLKFYQSGNGVWLTDEVDPKYISR
jgi:putative RNA 2'-phosphotransferase